MMLIAERAWEGKVPAEFAAALCAASVALLVWRLARLRGTTLVGPWWWTIAALVAVAGMEAWLGLSRVPGDAALPAILRFAAATFTLAPAVSLLGAKRPQDWAWQFVVAALVGVFWLPAGQCWLAGAGSCLELHAAWSWFLLALVLLGLVNHLATRFWLSALLAVGGQWALLSPQLPLGSLPLDDAPRVTVGLALAAAALAMATLTASAARGSSLPLDRVWLDFRDAFGAAWALRVQQRVNASAVAYQWDLALHWTGFTTRDGAPPAQIPPDDVAAALAGLTSVLRRFVSPEWIAERTSALPAAAHRASPKRPQ